MAVVTTKSSIVSNYDAQPRVITSGYLAGANDTVTAATVAAGAGDSANSLYKFCYIPSGVRIEDIQIQNDATTAGVVKLGLYTNTQQGGIFYTGGVPATIAAASLPATGADQIFGTGISTASAQNTWKSVYNPTILTGSSLAANVGLRVWELLGFSADPFYEFHMVATVTTGMTAAGTIALQVSWVR